MTQALVFIDGDQGTTGLQIHERLRGRDDLRILTLPAAERKDSQRRAEAINQCDIAILCLPDSAAREAVAAIRNPAVRVLDASSAHRLTPGWEYGFPEMAPAQAERIARAARVSNPGCYPTGAVGLLRPLVAAGLVPADYPITVHAVSGYSGKGRVGVQEHEGGADAPPYAAYGLGLAHKHTPEIEHYAGLAARPVFTPAYGSFRQGIALTIALQRRLLPAGADGRAMRDCLARHYVNSVHVQVCQALPEQLDPRAANGSNALHLHVFENAEHGHILLAAVFDNLGKGAAGAAVQNLDLMLQA
ncbi:N-acetyl-gamma-glutamyl-phosphate reductase [Bordetella avium]|uniref:N-acetyl-gamma-glutamyl-phosphate reductase n=1 Tax=Bordetella avium TaxID=521 RepID=UPI000E0ACB5F|nr:N-acetyl-gamma-glutamyl-phosphate reductase [Bordetella avium]RIQ13455.1 N-acetyl-gamma-glutamyl-phosphate reductase [Bordetella avium]RIQ36799.1 N-acetyl-gamma-glutamyl-phosphate reductase [Bordetella avium]RIQ40735.1 N-acetyl-gamma-glutamyl-phosphate reductase [Bordetella avium]RIQ42439.1 N-acetyl-gamma-glutamyl-phosphate reductase [Bordetella avium]RIQ48263.1 N-acetyl-gamma-glutamyl-phosphate reductase [Bordetella avium]